MIQQVQSAARISPAGCGPIPGRPGLPGRFLYRGRGTNTAVYTFTMPPGRTVTPEAYFELAYGNSSLLDYNRSALVVLLNNRPIGSVRMNDTTAANPVNKIRFVLPASAIQPGRNVLLVQATRVPTDDCTPPGTQDLWINLWPESTLHLPLDVNTVSTASHQDLTSYPLPFIYDPLLSNTAFVLPHDDLDAWRGAMRIAADLGFQANGPLNELTVFYGDLVPEKERANFNFIVIGRPASYLSSRTSMKSCPRHSKAPVIKPRKRTCK